MKKLLKALLALSILLSLVGCGDSAKYHVGVVQLVEHDALGAATQGFVDVLTEEFGEEVSIDIKIADGEYANCTTIANGYVSEGYDLILANATPALQAASSATDSIPILGTSVTEYGVALDIDNFSGVTGRNVSGTSDLAPLEDQAEMILTLVPDVKTVGIIYCSAEANSGYQVDVVTKYLESKGIEVIALSFTDSNDVNSTASELVKRGCDAIYVPTDNTAASYAGNIYNATIENDVPTVPIICGEEGTCKLCGVATLTIDYYELGRTTGEMAVKILKGEANISEMPIEYYANPVKKYNKTIAEKFDIVIPEDYIEIEIEE